MANGDFTLVSERNIPELGTRGYLYRHRTGARLLSLVNDDENKVFGISFRTTPSDSTGVAHILEHAVLCGSDKFPVKEPFVELLKGSLKTFLNAFTYPDKTCYPVASQNVQDFYNLIDVYLDAVFHPRLSPQVLEQEGWHYELEEADQPLTYKGVVYNEMKGANSSPEQVLAEEVQQSLFPDNTYGVNSGGHPRHIPDLTWEQFEAFHRTLYHPSNAWIYMCGDDDPERRFDLLEEYLAGFEPLEADTAVRPQPRFQTPRRVEQTYAVSDESTSREESQAGSRSMVAVNWLLREDIDNETGLGLQILDYVLMGTPASPLRRALIDSGLGEDVAGCGMEAELRQMYFSAGLKGVEPGREPEVEALVLATLEELGAGGIDADTVAAALNTTEFRLRENNTGAYPRGLVLMLRALSRWLHEEDPFEALAFEAPLQAVKEKTRALGEAADGNGYFEELIREHLLGNDHRTTVFLKPDKGQAQREGAEEKQRLDEARKAMSDEDVDQVMGRVRALKERQEKPDSAEDLSTLPRLQLGDLDRGIRQLPIEKTAIAGAPILYHDLFTNGIMYVDLSFDLRPVPQDLLPYLPLFGRALLEIGTEKQDFVRLSQRIGARTGGIWTHSFVSAQLGDPSAVGRFFIRGKAMVDQIGDMLDIMQEILLTVKLDNPERLLQMALEEKAAEESQIVPGGSAVVALRLRSRMDEAAWVSEQMEGITYLFFLRQLVEQIETDWSGVLAKLEQLRQILVNGNTLLCNATFPVADRAALEPRLQELIESLPMEPVNGSDWSRAGHPVDEGLVIPAQVNYVGQAGNLYDVGYELHGSAGVVTRFLRNTWLWDRVRVQGGAYGAFCSFDHFTGVFTYVSYRDPNILETLTAYEASGQFLRDLDLSDEELTKAIIGTIGDLDGYLLPDAKGHVSMVRELTGVTDEFRQEMRDAVLATTAKDFRDFAAALDAMKGRTQVVTLGPREALEAANTERPSWLTLIPVL